MSTDARARLKPRRRWPSRLFRSPPAGEAGAALKAASYVVVILACAAAIGPFFYILTTSIKRSQSLFSYPPEWIPHHIYWGNYGFLLHQTDFLRWTMNTLFVAGTVTVLKLVLDSMAGYAFAKMNFPGKRALFLLVLGSLMIPFSAILIPLFFLVRDLNLLDTYWALILPPLANPLGIFLMRSFIESLPNDLENAARLDGCSEFAVYRRVILPLIKAPLVVLAVLTFLIQYTSFVWPLVATSSDNMRVLTTGLASQRGVTSIDWGLVSAGGVMAMLPITVVFLVLQRYFIAGSLAGALKQ